MEANITNNAKLSARPLPVVQSYSRGAQFTTINVGRSAAESDNGGESEDGQTHSCTTLTVKSASPLSAADVFGLLWTNGLYTSISTEELAAIAERFGLTTYDALAASLISGRYTYAEELACHRKAILGDTAELEELTSFADECKAMAKAVFTDGE